MLKSVRWAAGWLALLWSCASLAQTYPTRPVRIIVPYQAGQGTDVVARYLADHLSRTLGQRFYVENKPGAGGNIGAEQAAHSDPDGYTLLMGTNATQTMNEFMYPSLGFAPDKDFAPIILVGKLPLVISASPSFAGNNVADLIAAAKAKPDRIDIALPSTTARVRSGCVSSAAAQSSSSSRLRSRGPRAPCGTSPESRPQRGRTGPSGALSGG